MFAALARSLLGKRDADSDVEWARRAARDLLDDHSDSSAIETANYRKCDFILEAARLALSSEDFAREIGRAMEPPRPGDR